VAHLKKYYYPDLGEQQLTEIFSRGGDRFLEPFEKQTHDREKLMGWLPNLVVQAEIHKAGMTAIRTPEDAEKLVHDSGEIHATFTWLKAMADLAKAHNVPARIFIIPTANVAPDFVDFWKPWPRYFSWYVLSEVRRQHLVAMLKKSTIPFIDLTDDLRGQTGTYRMGDAHWTKKGDDIAAGRVYRELTKIMPPDMVPR
jgi:hypothetical protein